MAICRDRDESKRFSQRPDTFERLSHTHTHKTDQNIGARSTNLQRGIGLSTFAHAARGVTSCEHGRFDQCDARLLNSARLGPCRASAKGGEDGGRGGGGGNEFCQAARDRATVLVEPASRLPRSREAGGASRMPGAEPSAAPRKIFPLELAESGGFSDHRSSVLKTNESATR